MKAILILDDNKACSATLKMTLMRRGYRIGRITDERLVTDRAWRDDYDLLLINHAYGKGPAGGWAVFNQLAGTLHRPPAMVYAMHGPSGDAAAWIAEAAEAGLRAAGQAPGRCPKCTPAGTGGVDGQPVRSGCMAAMA